MTIFNNAFYAMIVIVLATLVLNIINSKRIYRVKQMPLIIISVVYSVVSIILILKYYDRIATFTQNRSGLLGSEFFVSNMLVLIGFIIIKLIFRPIFSALWKKRTVIEWFSAEHYFLDEDYEEWFLFHKMSNIRTLVLSIVCGLVFLIGIISSFDVSGELRSVFSAVAFPAVVLLVTNEIYGYINGTTKEEFEHSILGDDADSRRISNYYKLREIYERLLPEALLSAQTGFEFADSVTPLDYVERLKESSDYTDKITAEYFDSDNKLATANVDCVDATLKIMHGNSVVFYEPFYKDLSIYLSLPLINSLLSNKNCLIVTGRMSIREDVKLWMEEVLEDYSHMKSLWKVALLGESKSDCRVGILSFPQLYNSDVILENRDFLDRTEIVILIEPSCILNTGQVALSVIAKEINNEGKPPVFIICDRNVDGLVDTLSHVLHTEITNAVAPPVPKCTYTGMNWDADGDFARQQLFDKQTQDLGDGIELAAIAVKNQVPQVSWYSETKVPIKDIKWIAGQYHPTICRYMNLPTQQKDLYDKINFVSSIWNSSKGKEDFSIVEDEFCNMFNTLRTFISRGTAQSFVNVISENYLLRDYMRCNKQMFLSNPDAIPCIVPDYAKTERNTLIKLLIEMAYRPVNDAEVIDEFSLAGIKTEDSFAALSDAIEKYTNYDSSILTVHTRKVAREGIGVVSANTYRISQENLDKYFADSLKSAYYILENEKHEEWYVDAKFFGHVAQTILPGQYVTYDGKYYLVKQVSPHNGVILRRAADHFSGRRYYRQLRIYDFENNTDDTVLSKKTVMDIEIESIQKSYGVHTTGYLELKDNHNLRTVRQIDFSEDPLVDEYYRHYRNKKVLRIKLPDTNDKICFTLCLLLSESFKTIFPDAWAYVAVVCKRPKDVEGILNGMVYTLEGDIEGNYIYVVEDSDIDLGLLEAVENNFMKLLEIVADFLEWHFEKMREPASKDPEPVSVNVEKKKAEAQRRNLAVRMFDRIRRIFGGRKEESLESILKKKEPDENDNLIPNEEVDTKEETQNTEEEYSLDDANDVVDEVETLIVENDGTEEAEAEEYSLEDDKEEGEEPKKEEAVIPIEDTKDEKPSTDSIEELEPGLTYVDGTDIFEEDNQAGLDYRIEEQLKQLDPIEKSRYQKECFLKFGYEEIDSRLELDDLRKYLRVRGWCNNAFKEARIRDVYKLEPLDIDVVNHCDFCGLPLTGVSYEMMNDGRIRCNDCSSSAISKTEDYKTLFYQTIEMLESIYGIRFKVPIRLVLGDARTVSKKWGQIFKPSVAVASRILGFAQLKRGKYSIVMENGSPRLAMLDTTVHELTHIWQYMNWNDSQVREIYDMGDPKLTKLARDIVYEGMAVWASIQYLYQIGETSYAARQEKEMERRFDSYGFGMKLYREQYPFIKDTSLIRYTPYASFPPIEPEAVKETINELMS